MYMKAEAFLFPFVYMIGHNPGHWLHIIIPGIACQIGVAVQTSTFKDGRYLLRYRVIDIDGIPGTSLFVFDGVYKLDHDEYDCQGNQDFL